MEGIFSNKTLSGHFLLYSHNNYLVKYSKKYLFYFETTHNFQDDTTDYNKNVGLIECNNKLYDSYERHKKEVNVKGNPNSQGILN